MHKVNGVHEHALDSVVIPAVSAQDADHVMAIGRAVAAAAEALCKAAGSAQALELPDPDGVGVVGLDYSALGEVSLSLLVWAGALLEGAHKAASQLTVIRHDVGGAPPTPP
jgi:hypothetical protein